MSISFFWLERGGGWGSSPLTSLANHQKLNVIQKWAFHFLAGEGWQMGFESIDQPSWSSEVEHNTKMSISSLWLERGGRQSLSPSTRMVWWLIIRSEHYPKRSISFYWLERGGGWGGQHQKLNVIQKWAFHFFGWRGVVDGVWVHWPVRPIIRSWT